MLNRGGLDRRLLVVLAVGFMATSVFSWGQRQQTEDRGSFRGSIVDDKAPLRDAPTTLKIERLDAGGNPVSDFDWSLSGIALKGVEDLQGEAIENTAARNAPEDGRRATTLAYREGAVFLENVIFVEDPTLTWLGRKHDLTNTIPGWLAILPPLLAILLAILFRQVLPALFAGIWLGGACLMGGPMAGFKYVVTELIPKTLSDPGRVSILIFSTLLGSVVALIARMGGTRGLVQAMSRVGESRRGAQMTTWFTGILVFFDDYANALLVGNTMRPISDKFRVSREKLAFLVDSTSAPVACIFIISTWIAAEIGYIEGKLELPSVQEATGWVPDQAYQIFLETIPYNFYPIFCLAFGFFIALMQRDFGPMLRAERRAYHDGKLLADNASPLSSREMDALEPVDPDRQHWWNAMIPIGVVILSVIGFLFATGAESFEEKHQAKLLEIRGLEASREVDGMTADARMAIEAEIAVAKVDADALASPALRDVFGAANSYHALLLAAFIGVFVALLLAVRQKFMRLGEAMEVVTSGIKAMIPAVLVLSLAWALQDVCERANTSQWLIHHMTLKASFLPMLIFILAAVIGFSTGTSWGTMGILVPLTMDYAVGISIEDSLAISETRQLLVASVGAVLAGSVFGDHCSPISDTTIMSSMSCGSDHVDHVKTQFPYALTVALIAITVGYLPAGFGVSPWIMLPAGVILCALAVRFLGRRAVD